MEMKMKLMKTTTTTTTANSSSKKKKNKIEIKIKIKTATTQMTTKPSKTSSNTCITYLQTYVPCNTSTFYMQQPSPPLFVVLFICFCLISWFFSSSCILIGTFLLKGGKINVSSSSSALVYVYAREFKKINLIFILISIFNYYYHLNKIFNLKAIKIIYFKPLIDVNMLASFNYSGKYRVRKRFFLQVLISWNVTLSSWVISQIISFILLPNEYGCEYAWATLGSGPVIDLQEMPILAKKKSSFEMKLILILAGR